MKSRSEKSNKELLIDSILVNRYFVIHRECPGKPTHAKPIKRLFDQWNIRRLKRQFAIDFILEPRNSLLAIGWELGCVGIEAKPSELTGRKFGKAVSQIFDYQNSVFKLSDTDFAERELSMVFLLGPDRYHGTEASILMQEGIGLIRIYSNQSEVRFVHGNGMHPILILGSESPVYSRPRFGMGTGHR